MKRAKAIKTLETLKEESLIYDDIIALDIAIRCVKKDKRSKEEFWKGYGIGFLVFLGFYILYHIGG